MFGIFIFRRQLGTSSKRAEIRLGIYASTRKITRCVLTIMKYYETCVLRIILLRFLWLGATFSRIRPVFNGATSQQGKQLKTRWNERITITISLHFETKYHLLRADLSYARVRAHWKIVHDIYSRQSTREVFCSLSRVCVYVCVFFPFFLCTLSLFRSQCHASLRARCITALRSVRSLFYDTINEWLTACRDVATLVTVMTYLELSFPFTSRSHTFIFPLHSRSSFFFFFLSSERSIARFGVIKIQIGN